MDEKKLKDGIYRIDGVKMEEVIRNGRTAVIAVD